MQLVGNYKQILLVLAIVAAFSTVGAERVSAKDVQLITNVSYSSESTGGVSTKGEDGEDGKPGEDDKPGKSGASLTTKDGKSSASIKVEATTDEVIVVKERSSETVGENIFSVSATHAATSSDVEVHADLQNTNEDQSSSGVLFTLQEAFFSLQLMLATYVNFLF